jgi:ferredoxin
MPKLTQYRNKCIGCGVCEEQQPELWRMSKKDGKATLLKSTKKNAVHVLDISPQMMAKTKKVAAACPVRIIKV